jgi:hypothetical protein
MEIDVAGRVDEVEHIFFAFVGVIHCYRRGFYGDAAFSLNVHTVEHLFFELTLTDGTCCYNSLSAKVLIAVVDVCYDTKISYILYIHLSFRKKLKDHYSFLCVQSNNAVV